MFSVEEYTDSIADERNESNDNNDGDIIEDETIELAKKRWN